MRRRTLQLLLGLLENRLEALEHDIDMLKQYVNGPCFHVSEPPPKPPPSATSGSHGLEA